MKPAICTQCGANIEVDETHEAGICPACHTAFITEKAINNFNISNTTINNHQTTYNINETVTKIIYGNEKDEAEDFFKRGLSHLSLKEYIKAEQNFKQAINLNPMNGIYRFYLSVASTSDFEQITRLFSHNFIYRLGNNPAIAFNDEILNADLSIAINILTNEEKSKIFNEFGLDLSSEIDLILSVFQKIMSASKTTTVINYEFIEKFYSRFNSNHKSKMLEYIIVNLKTKTFEYNNIKHILKLFNTIKQDLNEENFYAIKNNLKNYVNHVKDGIFYVEDVDFLDIYNDGTLIYPDNITKIHFSDEATVKLRTVVKKIYIKPTLQDITSNRTFGPIFGNKKQLPSIDIVEFDNNCTHEQVVNMLRLAIKMIILPENISEVRKDYFNHEINNFTPVLFCKNAFRNNVSVEYNKEKRWHFAAIMQNHIFFPLKEENNFIESINEILGENFLENKFIHNSVSPLYAYENNKSKDWNGKTKPMQVTYSKEPEFVEFFMSLQEKDLDKNKKGFFSRIFGKNK